MKKFGIIGVVAMGLAVTSCSGTEEKTIEKQIEITEDNGETQVDITTTEDGVTTEETYTGAEAKKKVKEIEAEKPKDVKEVVESVKEVKTGKSQKVVTQTVKTVVVSDTVKGKKGK